MGVCPSKPVTPVRPPTDREGLVTRVKSAHSLIKARSNNPVIQDLADYWLISSTQIIKNPRNDDNWATKTADGASAKMRELIERKDYILVETAIEVKN